MLKFYTLNNHNICDFLKKKLYILFSIVAESPEEDPAYR